jgi:hypothetical protein
MEVINNDVVRHLLAPGYDLDTGICATHGQRIDTNTVLFSLGILSPQVFQFVIFGGNRVQ